MAQGKNIVPTDTGLKLFGVLKNADPALVDPVVTAQLTDVDKNDVHIGMPVEMVTRKLRTDGEEGVLLC